MTPRLFLPPGARLPGEGEAVELAPGQRHYLTNVLRRRPGDRVVLLDGEAEAEATLLADLRLSCGAARRAEAPRLRLTLLCALLKGEKLDWVVEKATELGAARILPVACARSVRRLEPARASRQRERWARIATAAAQQCRRPDVPEVGEVRALEAALREAEAAPLRLLPYEGAAGARLAEALPDEVPPAACLLIGPEGGLAEEEVAAAVAAGFRVCGLGPRILRAETAALAALSILGDWAGART